MMTVLGEGVESAPETHAVCFFPVGTPATGLQHRWHVHRCPWPSRLLCSAPAPYKNYTSDGPPPSLVDTPMSVTLPALALNAHKIASDGSPVYLVPELLFMVKKTVSLIAASVLSNQTGRLHVRRPPVRLVLPGVRGESCC